MDHHRKPDSYLRRVGIAAALGLLAMVVVTLLSPRGDPHREWYEHTGIEGPTLILHQLDVSPDDDVVSRTQQRELPGATQGIEAPITEEIQTTEGVLPEPVPDRRTTEGDPERLDRITPDAAREFLEGEVAELHRASQQAEQFVLLYAIPPEYPQEARANQRARRIVVRVNLYVTVEGKVDFAYIDRNDGGPLFEEAVLRAVRQWIYKPLVIAGETTEFWDRIYFVFHTETGRVTLEPPAKGN